MQKARTLAARLRPLQTDDLARVTGGGETASTSTSGTPDAGDDTVGDATINAMPSTSFTLNYTKIHFP